MKSIKIGEYELRPWFFYKDRNMWSRDYEGDVFTAADLTNKNGYWHLDFGRDIAFLNDIYSGPTSFASIKEAKKQVNQFLKRMSKLQVFW